MLAETLLRLSSDVLHVCQRISQRIFQMFDGPVLLSQLGLQNQLLRLSFQQTGGYSVDLLLQTFHVFGTAGGSETTQKRLGIHLIIEIALASP